MNQIGAKESVAPMAFSISLAAFVLKLESVNSCKLVSSVTFSELI